MSRTVRFLAAALLIVLSAAPAVAGQPFVVDVERSSVRFLVPYHFMIVGLVDGRFDDFSGQAVIDRQALESASIQVEIASNSLDTALAARDLGLKSDLFFDAENHPVIRYVGRQVRRTETGLELLGTLSLRGVQKEMAVPFRLLAFGDELLVLGRVTVPRREFGLEGPLPSPEFAIGDVALVELQLTLVPAE